MGIDSLSFKPIAKIKLTCSDTVLFIDLSNAMLNESKNTKRKALKHGKINAMLQSKIDDCINNAVNHYLSTIHSGYY